MSKSRSKKPRKHAPARTENHTSVWSVLRAFDLVAKSPSRAETENESMVDGFMASVLDSADGTYQGWNDAAVRVVLVAHLLHCPETELIKMSERAARELMWLADHEVVCRYRKLTGKPFPGAVDWTALRVALKGEVLQ